MLITELKIFQPSGGLLPRFILLKLSHLINLHKSIVENRSEIIFIDQLIISISDIAMLVNEKKMFVGI